MMLASVSQDVQSSGRQGLPVLGGLPIVGRLFSSPTKNNRQVDIVISVTPRVLRAPAVTPRDEENRYSGTLQSPTTGSIEAMLAESNREEQIAARAAAARQIPKDVVAQVADPVTYTPAPAAAADQSAGNVGKPADTTAARVIPVAQTNAPTQTQPAALSTAANKSPSGTGTPNEAMPQPRSGAAAPQPQSMDVASALRNIVSPTTTVAETSLTAKSDPSVNGTVEQLAPKSEKTDAAAISSQPASGVMELRIAPDKNDLAVGDKRQIAVEFKSEAPLGLAVVTLRFDPHVIKINGVSAGKIFAGAKTAPALTQSMDQNGMLLVSLAPAASSNLSGEGTLINIDIEAINAGDSGLAFDAANVHLVAADGRSTTLELRRASLTVRQPDAAPAPKSNPDQTSAPASKPEAMENKVPISAISINPSAGVGALGSAVTAKSYVVQKHDNLWSIASQHSVSVAALRKANPSLRNSVLTIGSELVIP